jgi:hypothetical protein
MPDTSKHIWRTPKTAQSPYSYQLWCYSTNKWQNETGSVEGLARRPVGKVNRPSDLSAEFTCRLCEEGIVDYEVVKASISIDTDSFYE